MLGVSIAEQLLRSVSDFYSIADSPQGKWYQCDTERRIGAASAYADCLALALLLCFSTFGNLLACFVILTAWFNWELLALSSVVSTFLLLLFQMERTSWGFGRVTGAPSLGV